MTHGSVIIYIPENIQPELIYHGVQVMRKKSFIYIIRPVLIASIMFLLAACAQGGSGMNGEAAGKEEKRGSYMQISQDEAKKMMEGDDGHIIIDVRRTDEYEAGHIPGAVCIPNESIGSAQPEELPDLEQVILVYCRSGNRSKQAAQKLADIGYTKVYEFGGILSWTGEIETGTPDAGDAEKTEAKAEEKKEEVQTVKLKINDTEVPVTWEQNASVEALMKLAGEGPLTIQMSMYGGFEQVGPIGQSLVRNDEQITTEAGDIVLYSGNQIVIFYGSNSWAYTRLGHVDLSPEEMTELLGDGDVVLTIG